MVAKKSNPNPGILDWIFDFFVNPIKKAIAEVWGPILAKFAEFTAPAMQFTVVGKFVAAIKAAIEAPEMPKAPSPDKAWAVSKDSAWNQVVLADGINLGIMQAEMASFGQLDIGVQQLTRRPDYSASQSVAEQVLMSRFRSSIQALLTRYWLKYDTPLLPESYRLALGVSKGIIDVPTYDNAMAESGMSKPWADMWREQNYEYPTFDLATELFWRGEIDDATWTEWMKRRAMPEAAIAKVRSLRELIPTSDILITGVVREAHVPEMRVEAPAVFADWMAKKGYGKYWSDWIWTMHFLPMELRQAYENLWRGYWDKDKFMRFLYIADIHPMWREDIYNVAFGPLSIREMGYGWDMGVVDRDDIVRYRRMGGLSPGDAEKAADSLILYRTAAELEAVRRELLWQFAYERIDEDTFVDMLHMYETPEAAVPLWVARGKLQQDRFRKPEVVEEYRIPTSSEVLWAFENNLRDEAWTRQALAELDWTDERINLAIQRSKLEVERKVKPPEVVVPRKLTVAQLRSLYQAGLIGMDLLAKRLHFEVGYTIEDAMMLAQTMVPRPEVEVVKPYTDAWSRNLYGYRILDYLELYNNYLAMDYDEEHAWNMVLATILAEEYPALSAAYRKGIINQETFLSELVALGMEGEDAIELLERTIRDYEYERIERERELTKAEIIKGVKTGVLTPNEGGRLLEDIGYEDWEALFILAIEKVVTAGHPDSYWEMRRVTEAYKRARGEPWVEIPDEVLMLDKAIKDKKKEIEDMKKAGMPEEPVSVKVAELADLEATLKKVLVLKKIQ